MLRRITGAAAAASAALGMLAACGSGSDGTSTAIAASVSAPAAPAAVATDYSNIPGMAMGAPPETSSMNCTDSTCDIVYIPPSSEITKPFGVAVKLLKADANQVLLTVAGKQVALTPGKSTKAAGLTISVTGTPGTVVNLHLIKGS